MQLEALPVAAPAPQPPVPKLAVSLHSLGLVHPVEGAANDALRLKGERIGSTPPPEPNSDDELDDGMDMSLRALPALEAAMRDAEALSEEIDGEVRKVRRILAMEFTRAAEDDDNHEIHSLDPREVMYYAEEQSHRLPILVRDPQFNYLRKWVLSDRASASENVERGDAMPTWVVLDLVDRAPKAMNLTRLELTCMKITGLLLHALCTRLLTLSPNPITHLSLEHCGLTTDSVMSLCVFLDSDPRAACLTTLSLAYNKISEVGFKALEKSLRPSGVTWLSVRGNPAESDSVSMALLYALIDTKLLHYDMGFCGLGDSGVVKFCTVLRSRHCSVKSVVLDGANISPRVALLLLDTVCETLKLEALSTRHVSACHTPQFQSRIEGALQRAREKANAPPAVLPNRAVSSPKLKGSPSGFFASSPSMAAAP